MRRHKLPVPLEPLVDDRPPKRSAEMWVAIERKREKGFGSLRLWPVLRAAALAGLVLAVALHGLSTTQRRSPALRLASDAALPASMTPSLRHEALDLSDGSRITVARGARIDVLETSARVLSLALRAGRVRFDVRPHGPRAWRIDCGALTVEVVGTAFVVERLAEHVSVRVERGAVLVRGAGVPDGVQRLDAGERFETLSGPIATEPRVAASGPSVEAAPPPPHATHSRTVRTRAEPTREDALAATLARLWDEADRARMRGAHREASEWLEQLVAREVDEARAAVASFTLGKLALDKLDEPARAARHFERALAGRLPEPLAAEARARLALAHERSGERESACRIVRALPGAEQRDAELRDLVRACDEEPAR